MGGYSKGKQTQDKLAQAKANAAKRTGGKSGLQKRQDHYDSLVDEMVTGAGKAENQYSDRYN